MKKAILITLTALLALSAFTACGSKKDIQEGEPAYSRVLYDDDESSEEEQTEEEDESSGEASTNSEKKKDTNNDSDTDNKADSDKNKDTDTTSKAKTTSSKANTGTKTSSGSNSSRTTSSRITTGGTVSRTPTVTSTQESTVPSSSTPSRVSEPSTDTTTDFDTDTSTDTDTTWYGTDTDYTDTDTSSDRDTDTEVIVHGTLEASDMIFTVKDMQFEIGQIFIEEEFPLGSPLSENEVSNGKIYNYDECIITTERNDSDQELIIRIEVVSPLYPISKGIAIGSKTDDLITAFGDPNSTDNGYVYTYDDKQLIFTIMNGEVAEITFSKDN